MAGVKEKEGKAGRDDTRLQRFCRICATGFGLGHVPKAPGTAGALGGVAVGLALSLVPSTGGSFLILVALFAFSCLCAHVTAEHMGVEDPQIVVIDEIVGMTLAMWLIPVSFGSVAVSFVLFRLFDIYKPFPVKQMEEVFTGGASIVMDDVVAGIMANLLFRVGGVLLS